MFVGWVDPSRSLGRTTICVGVMTQDFVLGRTAAEGNLCVAGSGRSWIVIVHVSSKSEDGQRFVVDH